MIKILVPDETHNLLKWAVVQSNHASFLVNYCRRYHSDHPEYSERYLKWKREKEDEVESIVNEDRQRFQLAAGELMTISDKDASCYIIANPSDSTIRMAKNMKNHRLHLKAPEEYPSFVDIVMPPETGENNRELSDKRIPSITFQVTEECNLRCTYCYQINKTTHQMEFDTAKKMVDYILNDEYLSTHKNAIGFVLEFIGGEPLLMADLCNQIATYFFDQCIERDLIYARHSMVSLSSNGTLYFEEASRKFLKKFNRVISLGISIDGNKDLHDSCRLFPDGSGSYDIAMKACQDYKILTGSYPGSKMTLAHANLDYIQDAVISYMNNGWDEINLNCVYEDDWQDGDPTKLYYQLKGLADYLIEHDRCLTHRVSIFDFDFFKPQDKISDNKNFCGGNGAMMAVDYKGDLYTCIRFMQSSVGKEVEPWKIGDLSVGVAGTQLYKTKYDELGSVTRQSQSTEECMNCPISNGCGWCTGFNYQTFGTPNKRATYICEMHKARALANGYMWNKFFLKEDLPYVFHNYIPKEWAINIIGEEEYDMIIGLEQEILFSDKNDGREINMVNYGRFSGDDDYESPWESIVPYNKK